MPGQEFLRQIQDEYAIRSSYQKPQTFINFRFRRDWRTGPVFITYEWELGKTMWKLFCIAFSHVFHSFSHDSKRDNVTLTFYSAFPGYGRAVSRWEPSQNTKLKLLGVLLLCLREVTWIKLGQEEAYLRSLTVWVFVKTAQILLYFCKSPLYNPWTFFKFLMMCLWSSQSSCSLFVLLLCLGTANIDWASPHWARCYEICKAISQRGCFHYPVF